MFPDGVTKSLSAPATSPPPPQAFAMPASGNAAAVAIESAAIILIFMCGPLLGRCAVVACPPKSAVRLLADSWRAGRTGIKTPATMFNRIDRSKGLELPRRPRTTPKEDGHNEEV